MNELTTDPALTNPPAAVVENALATETPEPELSGDPSASEVEPIVDLAPAPVPEPHRGLSPFALKLLNEANQKAAQAAERAVTAERKAQEAEALAARLAVKEPPADPANPKPAQTQRLPDPAPVDARAEARVLAQQMRLEDQVNDIRAKGFREFGTTSFNDTINAVSAVGAGSADFVTDLIAVESQDPHILYAALAQDIERTKLIAEMPRPQRIAELTRMSIAAKPAKPAADPILAAPPKPSSAAVSRAPAPAPRLAPTSSKPPGDWRRDGSTEKEFQEGYQRDFVEGRRNRRR
jgi:hypothetical protein